MADFRHEQIGVNDAARLLGVRTSELKAAIREGKLIRGVEPPKPRSRGGSDGSGGWVFTAGDVMDVAEKLNIGNNSGVTGAVPQNNVTS